MKSIQKRTDSRFDGDKSPSFVPPAKTVLSAFLLCALTIVLCSCGVSTYTPAVVQVPLTLTGNWQFTVANPADGSFIGGLQGGFLQQSTKGGSTTGTIAYSVSLPGASTPCNTGSATVTGTLTGRAVSLSAVAGTQTFTFTGTLSLDSTTITGTYNSTSGTASDGSVCGTAQQNLQFSALLVQPLTGPVAGGFHSTGGAAGLINQDFLVTGSLTQAVNNGATAAVNGNLNFLNPVNNESVYPCFGVANVTGQISGNSVSLQIVGTDGTVLGQIGQLASNSATGMSPVFYNSVQGGFILQATGTSYLVSNTSCPGSLTNVSAAGDSGSICLGLNGAKACTQPITLSPASLVFPALAQGKTAAQSVMLTNTTSVTLNNLFLTFANNPSSETNFTESDDCGPNGTSSAGQPFYMLTATFCTIKIEFSPQCGTQCSSPLTATLSIISPTSADNNTVFTVPIIGTGISEDVFSNVTFDFRVGRALETNLPEPNIQDHQNPNNNELKTGKG